MIVAVLVLGACAEVPSRPRSNLSIESHAGRGSVAGVVRRIYTGAPYANSLILIKSTGIRERIVQVTADGLYRFDDLPPGRYTIDVMGEELERSFELRPGTRARVDFFVKPRHEIVEPWHHDDDWLTGITGK